jgi:hypothetical protein
VYDGEMETRFTAEEEIFPLIPTGSGAYEPATSWKREIYRAVKRAECHTNNSLSAKAEVKNAYGCTSIACTIFLTWYSIIKHIDKVSLQMVAHETKESEHHYSIFRVSVSMVPTCRYSD